MKALFIGRFQPFHNGHLLLLQRLSKQYTKIIIGIGSSQYHNTDENPFSFEERKQMIRQSLDAAGVFSYQIIAIPDIHNPPLWVNHVLSLVEDFNVVIANNPLTKKLFSQKGYSVKGTRLFERKKYSGAEIRRRIRDDEPWDNLVPGSVVTIIDKINGVNRIKKLHSFSSNT